MTSGQSDVKRMQTILLDAFAHPDRRAVFYSAGGDLPPASDRLAAMPRWDWSVQPWQRPEAGKSTCMVPLAMGCKPRPFGDGRGTWIEPCISSPAQADAIEIPNVWDAATGQVLRQTQQMAAELPADQQIREPDIQSPLGIAELMWDESFYIAMIETPDAVHRLLDKITRFQIAYIGEIQRLAGKRLNAAAFPIIWADHLGTLLSDDSMTLVSPAMHREFSLPYVNRIAQARGPLFYHSCSWRAAYFDNIRAIGPVRAWNWNPGNSDDPAAIVRAFSGSAVLAPHICAGMHRTTDLLAAGLDLPDEAALVERILNAATDNTCLMFSLSDVVKVPGVIDRIYDLFEQRGASPRAHGFA